MASETSICNQALSWLGASLILGIDDGTPNADMCKANYNDIRDAVLAEARWTFATKRITLTPVSNPPDFGYGQAFLIPSKVITLIEVRADSERYQNGVSNLDWRREEDKIVASVDKVFAKVIWQITDPSKFSALFVQAFASRLAADLAPAFTESNSKTQQLWQQYQAKIALAISMDGQQGRSDRIRNRNLTTLVR